MTDRRNLQYPAAGCHAIYLGEVRTGMGRQTPHPNLLRLSAVELTPIGVLAY